MLSKCVCKIVNCKHCNLNIKGIFYCSNPNVLTNRISNGSFLYENYVDAKCPFKRINKIIVNIIK